MEYELPVPCCGLHARRKPGRMFLNSHSFVPRQFYCRTRPPLTFRVFVKPSQNILFSPLSTKNKFRSLTTPDIATERVFLTKLGPCQLRKPHRRQTGRRKLTILGIANGQKDGTHDGKFCASRISCRPRKSRHIPWKSHLWGQMSHKKCSINTELTNMCPARQLYCIWNKSNDRDHGQTWNADYVTHLGHPETATLFKECDW